MNSFFVFNNSLKSTLKNYFFRTVQFSFKQGITFFIIFLAAKILSSYEFGVFSFIFATVMFFSVLSDFGVSRSTSKIITEESINKNHQLGEIFFSGLVIIIALSLACIVVILSLREFILDEFSGYIIYIFPIIFLFPLSSLFDGYYLGQKNFHELAKVFSIAGIISLVIDTYLILNYGLVGALLSVNIFYFLLVVLFFIRHQKKIFFIRKETVMRILRYAVLIGLPGLGFFLFTRANVYLLGKLNFIVEGGYFEFIDRAFIAAAFPFLMFGQILAPTITEKVTLNKRGNVLVQFKKVFWRTTIIAVGFTLVFILVFPPLIKFFYPHYYTEEFLAIFGTIIVLLPFILISNTINDPFIVGSGLARISLLTIPFGILNVILSLILVNYISYWGILYSTIFCSVSNKILSYFLVFKNLRSG